MDEGECITYGRAMRSNILTIWEKGEASGQFVAGSVHGAWMDTAGFLTPPKPAATTASRSSSASERQRRMGVTPSAAAVHRSQTAGATPGASHRARVVVYQR